MVAPPLDDEAPLLLPAPLEDEAPLLLDEEELPLLALPDEDELLLDEEEPLLPEDAPLDEDAPDDEELPPAFPLPLPLQADSARLAATNSPRAGSNLPDFAVWHMIPSLSTY